MRLGRVAGTVVSARKDERLEGTKLLVVRMLAADGASLGQALVAVDTVGAGEGEVVLVTESSSARRALGTDDSPADAAVVGIVDHWHDGDEQHGTD